MARWSGGQWALQGPVFAAFLAMLALPAFAQNDQPAVVPQTPSIATSLPANGDPTGARRWLLEHGISFAFVHTTELLSNLRGGTRRGTIFDGKLAPDAGCYFAESDFFEPDWQHSYWGSNYPRLLAAKDAYDPDGLFFVHHGVGSERWSADGFTRLT